MLHDTITDSPGLLLLDSVWPGALASDITTHIASSEPVEDPLTGFHLIPIASITTAAFPDRETFERSMIVLGERDWMFVEVDPSGTSLSCFVTEAGSAQFGSAFYRIRMMRAASLLAELERRVTVLNRPVDRGFQKQPIPDTVRWQVWQRDDFTCRHCGARQHLAVDHIHPESRGGDLELSNLQTLCRSCNSRKGAR